MARLEEGRVRGLVAGTFQGVLGAWSEVLGSTGGEQAQHSEGQQAGSSAPALGPQLPCIRY